MDAAAPATYNIVVVVFIFFLCCIYPSPIECWGWQQQQLLLSSQTQTFSSRSAHHPRHRTVRGNLQKKKNFCIISKVILFVSIYLYIKRNAFHHLCKKKKLKKKCYFINLIIFSIGRRWRADQLWIPGFCIILYILAFEKSIHVINPHQVTFNRIEISLLFHYILYTENKGKIFNRREMISSRRWNFFLLYWKTISRI